VRTPAIALSLLLPLLTAACSPEPSDRELLLATTTSVQDSGLLDELLPDFRDQAGITVRTIAIGTGAALRMGAEGNVDVLLTHAPEAERDLLESGAVLGRLPFMENFFVIAGPPDDPVEVAAADSAVDGNAQARGGAHEVCRP
jgi:tungstate transport system substrate-binding protein